MAKTRIRELTIMMLLMLAVGVGMLEFTDDFLHANSKARGNLTGFTNYSGADDLISISSSLRSQATQKYTGVALIDTLIVNVFVGSQILFSVPDLMVSQLNLLLSMFGYGGSTLVTELIFAILLFITVFAFIELATRSEI